MNRVKFFSKSDWGCGYNLERAYVIINQYDEEQLDYDINDILELYNITLYIDNECYLTRWTQEEISKIKLVCAKIKKTIGIFLSKIDDSNIEDNFSKIEKQNRYYDDFFEILEKYNIFKRISDEVFNILLDNPYALNVVLQNKKLVRNYGSIIRKRILENPQNAIILLKKFEIADRETVIFLPEELSNDDKEKLIIDYINCDSANLNYLRLIENIQSNKDEIEISDKTRLLTKRKIKEQIDAHFKGNSGMKMETLIQFSGEPLDETVKMESDGTNIKCTYDLNWIKENQDYATLLNNFIYLFFYVDMQMRITLVSKINDLGIFERHISINSKKAYRKGMTFERMSLVSDLQMMGYYERLKDIEIRIEKMIEWFFKEYLKEEFNIIDYRISIPSEGATNLEKCRTILSEMDHVLKEYQQIVEDGAIDHELIEISSSPIPFKDIKTLVKNKYVYACSEEYNRIQYYFFSDQCMLHYIERVKKSYSSFFELINHEKIKKEDYGVYAEHEINYLLENGYIIENEEGYLKINKKTIIYIFKDLRENEVINYWRYPKTFRKVIDELVKENILCFGESLLSKTEIDYYNYYLNKSEFNNGLDLRNKYIHGTQPSSEDAEEKHRYNYMIFLKLFILLLIKINDDFDIYFSDEYQQENKIKEVK